MLEKMKVTEQEYQYFRKSTEKIKNISVSGYEDGYLTGAKEQGVVLHDLRKNPEDLPPLSGELHSEMKPVLAYTQDLGWTSAIRRRRGRAIEWYCSSYDGNTIFFDEEIIAWTEIPAPQEL